MSLAALLSGTASTDIIPKAVRTPVTGAAEADVAPRHHRTLVTEGSDSGDANTIIPRTLVTKLIVVLNTSNSLRHKSPRVSQESELTLERIPPEL